jgi:hypothetical protein
LIVDRKSFEDGAERRRSQLSTLNHQLPACDVRGRIGLISCRGLNMKLPGSDLFFAASLRGTKKHRHSKFECS